MTTETTSMVLKNYWISFGDSPSPLNSETWQEEKGWEPEENPSL